MLIRFDSDDERGPSASLWHGLVDFVRGSLATALGQRDFEDFAPFKGADVAEAPTTLNTDTVVSGTTGVAATHETDRFGRVKITATAGTNAQVGLARRVHYDLQASPLTIVEGRIEQNADANSPIAFVGLSSQANPDDVFAAGVVNANGDAIGLRWNADETIDIVAVDAGTLTVLKDDIGVTVERTSGAVLLGLRIEKVTSTTFRLIPCVNGAIARSGAVNKAATLLPEGAMRPVAATTVAATTAPSMDVDYLYTADK